MGKKDLKKQYSKYDLSVIDYMSMIDPSGKNKFLPFLMKQLEKYNNSEDDYYIMKGISNRIDHHVKTLLKDFIGGESNFELLKEFNTHLENNRIEKTDINEYNSWEDFLNENGKAELKIIDKSLTKQIIRIYEDENYLVLKPLSFKASLAYGSGTKWCTAMKTEPSYFYRYCSQGILIYVVNKVDGKKFGFYSSVEEFSVWNSIDSRIDSMQSGLPFDLLNIIIQNLDINKNQKNSELFSEEENKNAEEFLGFKKAYLQPLQAMEPVMYGEAMEPTTQYSVTIHDEDVLSYDIVEESVFDRVDAMDYTIVEEDNGSWSDCCEGIDTITDGN